VFKDPKWLTQRRKERQENPLRLCVRFLPLVQASNWYDANPDELEPNGSRKGAKNAKKTLCDFA
jgi:hypothetical protein